MKLFHPALLFCACLIPAGAGRAADATPKPMNATPTESLETITLGGGCFWCVEAVFEKMDGVKNAVSGYMGGDVANPTYEQVCSGRTGHAEVVRITFDPVRLPISALLDMFWKAHDPTTPDRQGADVGTQYRSVIFYHNTAQKDAAEQSKTAAAPRFADPIVTAIQPAAEFYPAEEYHQDYFARNPTAGYCAFVIRPKLKKLGFH